MGTEPRTAKDDTPTRPTRRPFIPLDGTNGLRSVQTNSVEHDKLVELGFVPVESDDRTTIMRPARRATDSHDNGDARRFREHERGVLEQIAVEIVASQRPLDGEALRWAMDEFRVRVMRETGASKTVVSGRLR